MTPLKSVMIGALLAVAMSMAACQTASPAAAQDLSSPSSPPPAELLHKPYLFEVMRYLYQWQLDQAEIEQAMGDKKCLFWVRKLNPALDPGDKSAFAEIRLPQLGISVGLKNADYTIDELKLAVKSNGFKITAVTRGPVATVMPAGYQAVEVEMKEMLDYLFQTRDQRDFADATLVERMRGALREEAAKEGISTKISGDQVAFISPLSPVANEIWVFWEGGRKLLHFSSDIDLANPAVWARETLMVQIFDLDDQVVVSEQETAGSDRFLTRYEVGRAMFNCVVLGQRIVVPPHDSQTAPLQAH